MDPNANLDRLLELARRMADQEADDIEEDNAIELAELILALDEWLRRGGFLPRRWLPR